MLSSAGTSETLKITDAKLSVPVVTLSSIGNVKLAKQLSVGFKRFVYSNEYLAMPTEVINNETNISRLLDSSLQGFKRYLFFHMKLLIMMMLIKQVTEINFFQEQI